MATIDRATRIFQERGGQYGDTWRECRFLAMKAVAKELSVQIPDDCFRALATAAFVDMKYFRLLAGYKDDSVVDGMNYSAFLAEEVRAVIASRLPPLAGPIGKTGGPGVSGVPMGTTATPTTGPASSNGAPGVEGVEGIPDDPYPHYYMCKCGSDTLYKISSPTAQPLLWLPNVGEWCKADITQSEINRMLGRITEKQAGETILYPK